MIRVNIGEFDPVDNTDIQGRAFPVHEFEGVGVCSFTWEGRPCTFEREARIHPKPTPPTKETTVTVLESLFSEAMNLAAVKDAAYGGAWRRQGYMGNVARVLSKVERIRELLWSDRVPETREAVYEETAEDTLLDLINIAAMALQNVREGNRWGER